MKSIHKNLAAVAGILVLFAFGFGVFAWADPTAAPPAGNVPPPVQIGRASAQNDTTASGTKSIWVNKANGGELLRLQAAGSERFVLDSSGNFKIISSNQNALRLQKTPSAIGSVELFPAIGDSTTRTGTELCQIVSVQAICLGYWNSTGSNQSCSPGKIGFGRALCADFGD